MERLLYHINNTKIKIIHCSIDEIRWNTLPGPPLRRGSLKSISQEMASMAVETVKVLLEYIVPGPLLVHRHPDGLSIDVPVMYNGVALDRVHYDLLLEGFSPKGRPALAMVESFDIARVEARVKELFGELRAVDAAEFREPEDCWVVPLAWGSFIVAHIRVSRDGGEVVPDRGLTAEVSSRVA